MFAVFALGIKHVAAHRISAHSIDTSRRSSVEEEREGVDCGGQIDPASCGSPVL